MSKTNFLRLMLMVLFLLGFWSMVQAARLEVTTTQDNVPGSLRAAITTANSNNEDDTIYLPAGTYKLGGAAREDENTGGDLDINTFDSITIIGSGPGITIIDGNEIDRVFHILEGTVSIIGVSIVRGKLNCPSGDSDPGELEVEHGGGIYNSGNLTLKNCTVSNNVSKEGCSPVSWHWDLNRGGHGGGIYNNGTLSLTNCSISNNRTSSGETNLFEAALSGDGGGIYNAGTLYLADSRVTDNITSYGALGRVTKPGGNGAGIYNTGTMILIRCTIRDNTTGKGGTGIHSGIGNSGGHGGGIYNQNGNATISYCTISNNKTGDGGGADDIPGPGGIGAGIYNTGTLILDNSAVINNSTGNGNIAMAGGSGGNGGGIGNLGGNASLTNCTISGNTTGSGKPSVDSYFDVGSGGNGAGIYNNAQLSLKSCTVSDNITGSGGDDTRGGSAGGVYCSVDGTGSLQNTIVADNQVAAGGEGPDCWGTLSSQGYNLMENTNNCTINGELTGNITGVDPQLGPLAYNGGLTKTHALKPGSPAVDAGASFGLSIDQRGYIRPMDNLDIINVNDGADIGAYEYNAVSLPQISLNPTLLNFGIETSNNAANSQTFFIDNSGEGKLAWTTNPDVGWLNCTPASGTGPGLVTVQVDSQGLSAGVYIGNITVEAPGAINSPQIVTVILKIYTTGSSSSPFGVFATPLDGTTVSGSIPVTGWALDDIGIQSVQLFREEGNSLVYIGDAVFVEGARPDVAQAYPGYPNNYKAGWGYMMLTNFLPNGGNGTFTIHAAATDFEGNQVTLGTKTIICDNANRIKPFGAIDTPEQGGIASGSDFINFGWALTPLPNTIPPDGSSITVWVDSVPLGNPVYNRYRKDVAALFPGYNNSAGAGGHYYLDTTKYENGVHTISWSVTDSAGNTDGIGSRYFRIQNSGETAAGKAQGVPGRVPGISQIPVDYSAPVKVVKGYNQNTEPQIIYPDHSGNIVIDIRELDRIEVWLSEGTGGLAPLPNVPFSTGGECSTRVAAGFQLIGDRLAALPIGSFLDSTNGIFSWQPGPGYLCDHELVFFKRSKTGEVKLQFITIRIRPQFK